MNTAPARRASLAVVCHVALAALTPLVPLRPRVETGLAAGRGGSFWVTR
jgi:hypothetical protein